MLLHLVCDTCFKQKHLVAVYLSNTLRTFLMVPSLRQILSVRKINWNPTSQPLLESLNASSAGPSKLKNQHQPGSIFSEIWAGALQRPSAKLIHFSNAKLVALLLQSLK